MSRSADELLGRAVPPLTLPSTVGPVELASLCADRAVVFIYPRTGRPGVPSPAGWDEIPGVRGCTAQACAFRDHASELAELGARVAGLSAQTLDEQLEFSERSTIPFPLVADPELRLAALLDLPTFAVGDMTLYKRLTFVAEGAAIRKVFFPVFPPERNAGEVVRWLRRHRPR